MFRSTAAAGRAAARATLARSVRFNSTSAAPKRGRLLVGVGILAVGSTIAASLYNKDKPKAAVEPLVGKKAFPDEKIDVVFVLGGPGSGKGTQCAKLVNEQGYVHLSAGDLLRAEQKREGSQYGDLIRLYIKEGKIVPQEVTIALLQQAIEEQFAKGASKFLVDGFPRKMDQALTFEEKVATSSITLFFDCPEAVMLKRLLERGKTSGREDDNAESIKKRFRTFLDTSMPVVDYYDNQDKVLKVLCDQPVDEVYKQVTAALKGRGI